MISQDFKMHYSWDLFTLNCFSALCCTMSCKRQEHRFIVNRWTIFWCVVALVTGYPSILIWPESRNIPTRVLGSMHIFINRNIPKYVLCIRTAAKTPSTAAAKTPKKNWRFGTCTGSWLLFFLTVILLARLSTRVHTIHTYNSHAYCYSQVIFCWLGNTNSTLCKCSWVSMTWVIVL